MLAPLEDDNIKCTVFFLAFKENPFFSILIKKRTKIKANKNVHLVVRTRQIQWVNLCGN
jgi:hypothetical protein